MQSRAPIDRDLVLVGGGHAHVHVLKRLGMRPLRGVRLTLVSRDVETPYSGMLPGYVAGHYGFDECHIDLVRLARFAGARLIHDDAIGLDREARHVLCRAHPPIRYDLMSLDIGSAPRRDDDVPGAAEHTVAVKPIDSFAQRWEALLKRATLLGRLQLAVVGGGAGGVELALAAHHRLRAVFGVRTGGDAGHPRPAAVVAQFAGPDKVRPNSARARYPRRRRKSGCPGRAEERLDRR